MLSDCCFLKDDPSNILERNKFSSRMTEPPVKNGVQRKREKSSLVKRDWVQPPPKIFISSVVKDQEPKRSPVPLQIVDDRPWDSEDSSVGSSPSTTENRPPSNSLGTNKDASSPLSSPQPSLIDSAMDFPESWAETPSELPQSCSNDSLRDSTSAGDLTSLGSPLESERGLQDQVESELFIDEGNFSLSLETRSALLSEEEDAYRYILDLKEEEPANDASSEQIVKKFNMQEPSLVTNPNNPSFSDPCYGDGDSGYYPEQKDISTAEADDVAKTLLSLDSNKAVAVAEIESMNLDETREERLDFSYTEAVPKVSTESDQTNIFEDDQEWPVVQYERISISGSEEDVEELGAHLHEEPLDDKLKGNQMPDVFSDRMEDGTIEDNQGLCVPEQDRPNPDDTADQISKDYELPQISTNSSQSGVTDTEAEIQEEQKSGTEDLIKNDKPTIEDLSESYQQVTDSLVEINFPQAEGQNPESRSLKQSKKLDENVTGDEETIQEDLRPVQEDAVAKSKLNDDLNATLDLPEPETLPEDGTIKDNAVKEDNVSSGQNINNSKATEEALIENYPSVPVSMTSRTNSLVSDVTAAEASDEPNPGAPSCEEYEQPFSPPTPSIVDRPYDDENEGQAIWEESRIVDTERTERYRAELRLSLSVTPLQPAPTQPALTDSDGAQEKVITVRN